MIQAAFIAGLFKKKKKEREKRTNLLHIRPDSYVQKTYLRSVQMTREVASILQRPLLTGVAI